MKRYVVTVRKEDARTKLVQKLRTLMFSEHVNKSLRHMAGRPLPFTVDVIVDRGMYLNNVQFVPKFDTTVVGVYNGK